MAKRYYISRVIGAGTRETPYNSELRQYIVENWPNEPHFIHQAIYAPILIWCIHKYDLSDPAHTDIMASVHGIFSFPSGALDRELNEIPLEKRQAIKSKLESIGFDFDWTMLNNTVRDVLKYLLHTITLAAWAKVVISNNNFDLNKTIADVPIAKRQNINRHLQGLGVPTDWITLSTSISDVVNRVMFHADSRPRLFGTRRKQWLWHDEDVE